MISETDMARGNFESYCKGNGVDIGSGGSPCTKNAIQIDKDRYCKFGPVHYVGNGAHLPFKDETLDFVYSSHLLEDFFLWPNILKEWTRVIKPDGFLVLMVPEIERFRAAVRAGQPDNLDHQHEFQVGELSRHFANDYLDTFTVVVERFCGSTYNILFVAQKKLPPYEDTKTTGGER